MTLEGLRNARGLVHFCVTRAADHFPDCADDPDAVRRTLPAAEAGTVRFQGLAEGDHAVAVVHDENGNGRLDTLMGVPREGFGFSRNPRIAFGPPRFHQASLSLNGEAKRHVIRVRYLL